MYEVEDRYVEVSSSLELEVFLTLCEDKDIMWFDGQKARRNILPKRVKYIECIPKYSGLQDRLGISESDKVYFLYARAYHGALIGSVKEFKLMEE
jgi:hypothetical protein